MRAGEFRYFSLRRNGFGAAQPSPAVSGPKADFRYLRFSLRRYSPRLKHKFDNFVLFVITKISPPGAGTAMFSKRSPGVTKFENNENTHPAPRWAVRRGAKGYEPKRSTKTQGGQRE